jgi:hypothetical protein
MLTKPGRRSLGLNLFYTDDCPDSYEPQGFTRCIDEDLYFPTDDSITRKSKKSSRFLAGAHRAGVVVSHVDAADDRYALRALPQTMDYSTKRSRLDEYTATNEVSISYNTNPNSPSLPVPSQPLVPSGIMASPAAPSSPTGDDLLTKEALQRMQRSSSRPQGLMPTQSLVGADAMMAGGGADEDSYDENSDAGAALGSDADDDASIDLGGAAAVAGPAVAAGGLTEGRRKMSQSELVAFDLSTSEVDVEMGNEDGGEDGDDEDEDDMYN